MSTQDQQLDFNDVMNATGPYPVEAYNFVREGLSHTAEIVYGATQEAPDLERHVSGQQLCLGLRDYAIDRYGLMAPVVLDHWKIKRTDDFGRIVFAMIDAGLMSRTPEDSLEDFRSVFDFAEAFSRDELVTRIGSN